MVDLGPSVAKRAERPIEKSQMTKDEVEVLASVGAHIGVAFGILSRYLENTHEDPKFAQLNEAAVLWMRSTVDNVLKTSSEFRRAEEHEAGYGAGV